MKLLLLGYSNIVQRKVLPAAIKSLGKENIIISSRRDVSEDIKDFNFFHGFENALENSNADAVYISTINSEHFAWAELALNKGLHVLIDKPAFLNEKQATKMVELAKEKGLLLAETTVFLSHPQVSEVKNVFNEQNCEISKIMASFTMPAFNKDNFRNFPEYGGGAVLDLGSYAFSTARYYLGSNIKNFSFNVETTEGSQVDTGFSVYIEFENNKTFLGHFIHGMEYSNQIQFFGKDLHLTLPRFFTTPDSLENTAIVLSKNNLTEYNMPAGDSFSYFIESCSKAIQEKNFTNYYDELLSNANLVEQMMSHN